MDSFTLELLRCPDCRQPFKFTPAGGDVRRQNDYGLLRCRCYQYPVVDGIPIILKGHVGLLSFWSGEVESRGPHVDELCRLLEKGRGLEALVRCLAFTPRVALLDRLPGWRLWHTGVVPALTRKWVERRLTAMLTRDRPRLSAEDWFEFFFGDLTPTDATLLPVYRNRFVLPRTLAALSLLRLMPSSEKPILDLACGFGPFGHYLTTRRKPTPVIGVDFNFYLVWGQKHWIAPRGTFLCADATVRLPFADDAFAGTLCSDAFVYFRNKREVLAELTRCAPERPLILTRVGNRISPHEAEAALRPEEYMELFTSGEPRAFSEYALVRHYLARTNPLTSEPTDPAALRWDKWLTFVLNAGGLADAHDEQWPHAVGDLAVSPLFRRRALPNGRVKLSFHFPSTWFAYQNGDMYGYHGDHIECDPEILISARSQPDQPQVKELIERFILVGLPDRYLKVQLDDTHPRRNGGT